MTLETLLKKKRIKLERSQKDLAMYLGYGSSQFVSNAERGKCKWPLKNFKLLSKFLEVELETMIKLRAVDFRHDLENRFLR
jgi:transcriptional regulator with XRE-family HTH domain